MRQTVSLALAIIFVTPIAASAQNVGHLDDNDPNFWTALGGTDTYFSDDLRWHVGKGKLYVHIGDTHMDTHDFVADIVYDEEQKSEDNHLYWQQAYYGGVWCGKSSISVDYVDLLDRDGETLVAWKKPTQSTPSNNFGFEPVHSGKLDDKIYHAICGN